MRYSGPSNVALTLHASVRTDAPIDDAAKGLQGLSRRTAHRLGLWLVTAGEASSAHVKKGDQVL